MKILVLGGGAREHALLWSLRKSPRAGELVCAPGNGGIASLARCVPVDLGSLPSMLALVEAEQPALVVVGPELPLAVGIVDALQLRGVPVFGPTRAAAQLETSKAFAKEFMRRWGIPTAAYAVCRSVAEVEATLPRFPGGVVVKADGLAAGKGVILCDTATEALAATTAMFSGALLGTPADTLVLEERLTGPEVSFFALCDGGTAVMLGAAQDHKRIGEGDTGPNTGGMGAYSTGNLLAPKTSAALLRDVAQRVVEGMKAEGTPFAGVLFAGLMLTPHGPRVLEFNTRFGDPETEAILLRLDSDLLDLLEASAHGTLHSAEVRVKPGAAACVVVASGGYPGAYEAGKRIEGLQNVPAAVHVFHAGTALREGQLQTAGGRVLAVSAYGETLPEALASVYAAIDPIRFEAMQFRRDIGRQPLSDA